MTDYNVYVLILCLIVFTIFTALSAVLIFLIVNYKTKLLRCGAEDEAITEEYRKQEEKAKKTKKRSNVWSYVFNAVFCALFAGLFVFSVVVNVNENSYSDSLPTMRVVRSNSMSKKLSGNDYLYLNHLNDQFQMHDIIFTYKIPDEFDLKVYDIVVYEVDEVLIVHRIVEIEEPNSAHPDCRHFRLQGDAVGNFDRFPVLYSQMRGIYRGERIRFVGSFVSFMQSPAGWLCLLLVVGVTVFSPVLDNKIEKETRARLRELGVMPPAEKKEKKSRRSRKEGEK